MRIDKVVNIPELMVLTGCCQSKSEAKRLIKQNAVSFRCNNKDTPTKVTAEVQNIAINQPTIFKVGKRRYFLVEPTSDNSNIIIYKPST